MKSPTFEDSKKLVRVLGYLQMSKHWKKVIERKAKDYDEKFYRGGLVAYYFLKGEMVKES